MEGDPLAPVAAGWPAFAEAATGAAATETRAAVLRSSPIARAAFTLPFGTRRTFAPRTVFALGAGFAITAGTALLPVPAASFAAWASRTCGPFSAGCAFLPWPKFAARTLLAAKRLALTGRTLAEAAAAVEAGTFAAFAATLLGGTLAARSEAGWPAALLARSAEAVFTLSFKARALFARSAGPLCPWAAKGPPFSAIESRPLKAASALGARSAFPPRAAFAARTGFSARATVAAFRPLEPRPLFTSEFSCLAAWAERALFARPFGPWTPFAVRP